MKKVLIVVLLIAIAGGAFVYNQVYNKKTTKPQVVELEKTDKKAEPQVVTSKNDTPKLHVSVPFPPDYILGDPNSKIQMIEYSSMTCPHCADYHVKIYPEIKKKYINTGKIGYRLRHYPLDKVAFNAAKVTHCAGKDKYYKFVDVFFKVQKKWAHSGDTMKNLKSLARLGGMSGEAFDDCMKNKELEKQLLSDMKDRAMGKYKVSSTPSIYINDVEVQGDRSVEIISKIIDDLL